MPEFTWRVISASVQGSGHARSQAPCQDANCWRETRNGVLIAAVADGAGSVPLAEIGSTLAAQAAVGRAAEMLGDNSPDMEEGWCAVLREGTQAALEALQQEAEVRACPLHDLATTLLLVLATSRVVATMQVGDGAVTAQLAEQGILAITRPPPGEYVNETTFLTSPNALAEAQVRVQTGKVMGLAVLTDGLQRLALSMPQGDPYPPFFEPFFRFAASATDLDQSEQRLKQFLQSPRFAERTEDDVTLLLAIPVPSEKAQLDAPSSAMAPAEVAPPSS